jgi:methylenetetrahydrofolate dehydrogenase (NADP+) / methenyltetrahydrofolate cyclohydrolase
MTIDGKKASLEIQAELAERVAERVAAGRKRPHLAAVLVGDNPASQTYVNHKVKACDRVGFDSTLVRLPADVKQEVLISEVRALNEDSDIDGFIVQLPLPKHLDEQAVIEAVAPDKDVDGFHPLNVGRMALGLPAFLPATPAGIIELLRRERIETEGKHAVIIGRSNIVGGPMSILLRRNAEPGNCTVTLCHSRTQSLTDITRQADILVAAIGRPGFVTRDMVKPGAVVIDVGINSINDSSRKSGYRLVGDVDFLGVSEVASAITPVPGGVGPMTIAALLMNTLMASNDRDES